MSFAPGFDSDPASSPVPAQPLQYDELSVRLDIVGNCGGLNPRYILGELSPVPPNQITIGHGTSGTVLEAGLKCHLEPGTKVAIYLITPCRRCACCKERQYSKCIGKNLHKPHTPGSVITILRALVVPLPSPLTLDEGALIQVLALAVKIVNTADPKPGQSFVVLGVSCIGILCCLLARARGVRQIMVVDRDESLLDVARRFVRFSGTRPDETVAAITCVVPEGVDALEGAAALVQAFGREPDICVNATGEYGLMNVAYKAVKAGGVYVHAGVRESDVSWDVLEMWRDDVKIHGGVGCEDLNYEEAVKMVMYGEVSLREFCHQG
ncbi:NAD(P)-binding protein [Morchella conica CCBAS932]|uniref:NAD(P)-binding protein n=1 Tax=Morchella conica CCBAS932 TaxID=1392247 RepID=A0A3N4KJ43_9PEZI|nr:NAD(P)-binding protein [Morchella conica CCBAS932]